MKKNSSTGTNQQQSFFGSVILFFSRKEIWFPFAVFLISRALIFFVVFVAQTQLDRVALYTQEYAGETIYQSHSENFLFAGLAQWDAGHYLAIAIPDSGYFLDTEKRQTNTAFFPFYPLLIRMVTMVIDPTFQLDVLISVGLLLSNGFFLGALLLLYRFVSEQWGGDVAERAVLFITLFPTAFFYSAVYTESLFLFLSILTCYLLEKKRWWLAAIVGGLASATRVVGIMLLPVALWYLWQEWQVQRKKYKMPSLFLSLTFVRSVASSLILYPMGLISFSAYLWINFQDPLAYIHTQEYWGRYGYNYINTFINIFGVLYWRPLSLQSTMAQSALFALFFFGVGLWRVSTHLKAPYLLYSIGLFFLPLGSHMFSLARYTAVIFPLFISLALGVKNRYAQQLLTMTLLVLQVCYLIVFSRNMIMF